MSEAGTTPRYLMVGVLCSALGLGALLTPSARPSALRDYARGAARTVALEAVALVGAGFYATNLGDTYHGELTSRQWGTANEAYFGNLAASVRRLDPARASSIVSGVVPGFVYYGPPDPTSDSAGWSP